jgi:hypothetical protein
MVVEVAKGTSVGLGGESGEEHPANKNSRISRMVIFFMELPQFNKLFPL